MKPDHVIHGGNFLGVQPRWLPQPFVFQGLFGYEIPFANVIFRHIN